MHWTARFLRAAPRGKSGAQNVRQPPQNRPAGGAGAPGYRASISSPVSNLTPPKRRTFPCSDGLSASSSPPRWRRCSVLAASPARSPASPSSCSGTFSLSSCAPVRQVRRRERGRPRRERRPLRRPRAHRRHRACDRRLDRQRHAAERVERSIDRGAVELAEGASEAFSRAGERAETMTQDASQPAASEEEKDDRPNWSHQPRHTSRPKHPHSGRKLFC